MNLFSRNFLIKSLFIVGISISSPVLAKGHHCRCSSDSSKQHTFQVTNKVVTGNSPFPCPPPVIDPNSHPWPNTEIEPAIAVGHNPTGSKYPMVVIAYQQDRYNTGGGSSALYMIISLDGGKTFGSPIPLPDVLCFDGTFERDTDAHLAISKKGDIYFSGVPFSNYTDTGNTNISIGKYNVRKNEFTYVKYLDSEDLFISPFGSTDYDGVHVDPQDKSGKTAYVTWDFVYYPGGDYSMGPGIIRMSKTTDGVNWSSPIDVYQFPPSALVPYQGDAGAQIFNLALFNNPCKKYSKLLATFSFIQGLDNPDVPTNAFWYSSVSSDQGNTWSNPIPLENTNNIAVGLVVDPDDFEVAIRSGDRSPFPAVDRKNNILYVVTQEHSLVGDGIPTQIILYASTDSAASWNRIGPVNTVLTTQAFTPAICVLRDGRIAISYYDFRNHVASNPTGPLETDRWMDIYSFSPKNKTIQLKSELRLTDQSFNHRFAPSLGTGILSPPGLFLADYVEQKMYKGKIYHAYPIVPQNSGPNNSNIQLSIVH
jgi:hypothetical protein